MWWGEVHLLLVVMVLAVSAIGEFRHQFFSSLSLLGWWLNINLLWEYQGPQVGWTAISGLAFIGLFYWLYRKDNCALYFYLMVEFFFVEILSLVAASGLDPGLFMSLRGALFMVMCLTVAGTWRHENKWISHT